MHALVIFAVALAVRLIHIWQIKPSPFFDILLGDANGYDQWAQRLAAGDWIGSDVFYQAPLYPYFLGRRLRDLRPRPADRPDHPGADRIGVVRAARPGRGAVLLETGRSDRRPRARAVGAGDLLRRAAAEVGARHVLRVPGAVVARTACPSA